MGVDPIESDALDGASYDAASRVLTVRFVSGGVYEYFDVDQSLFDKLRNSQPHPWSVVGNEVKRHRFRRLA